jgi:alcohol dehydrogenase (cytochrome c)
MLTATLDGETKKENRLPDGFYCGLFKSRRHVRSNSNRAQTRAFPVSVTLAVSLSFTKAIFARVIALPGKILLGSLLLAPLALGQDAGPPGGAPKAPPTASHVKAYLALCASCHGPDMKGGSGGSILSYVRYHTDREVTARVQQTGAHSSLKIDDWSELLREIRALAGTNPNMATGGFTGQSWTWGHSFHLQPTPPEPDPGPNAFAPKFQPRPEILTLTNGQTLQGTLMAESSSDAQLLAAGKIHLLAREGGTYLDKAIEPKSNWLTYHGNISGNRYSPLDQINTANVQKLGVAWKFPIPTSPRLQGTPLVEDGVMYMTGWNELFALDATTGSEIWSYHQRHTQGILGEAGRGSNRGVAIAGNRLFFLTDSAHLLAFDKTTGAKLWEVESGSIRDGVMSSSAPLVAGDLVLIGVGGGEEGIRGFIDAYKVDSGEHAWRFYTIPKRGEKAAATWRGNALEHGCGSTWMTGSYDPGLDLVYWGVGNPCPDANGSERMGDNLYTNSVVALSRKTGELKWHFQFTPHDTHDWDSTQSMVLIDQKWQGQERRLLVHGDRNGYFFVLDRSDGKLLLATPLSSKVTWSTGYGKDGRPILSSTPEATSQGTATCPGGFGGTNWIDPSYSPITNLFYVRASDTCGIYTAGVDPLDASNRWGGGGIPADTARQALKELMNGYNPGDFIRAFDIFTGKKVWDYPDPERSGILSTAGGLLLIGSPNGLIALDAKTGKELTAVDAGLQPTVPPVFAASPMTYMVGGKQYIVLPATAVVVAYELTASGGHEKQIVATQESRQLPDGPGKQNFVRICGSCHSPEVVMGKGFTADGWTQVVGTMIERGAQGTDDQFTSIVQYLKTNFPPIIPAVNVNSASADIMMQRLGITAEQAQAIVDYRERHGNFKSVDDLKNVPKLDFSKVEANKNMLVFN